MDPAGPASLGPELPDRGRVACPARVSAGGARRRRPGEPGHRGVGEARRIAHRRARRGRDAAHPSPPHLARARAAVRGLLRAGDLQPERLEPGSLAARSRPTRPRVRAVLPRPRPERGRRRGPLDRSRRPSAGFFRVLPSDKQHHGRSAGSLRAERPCDAPARLRGRDTPGGGAPALVQHRVLRQPTQDPVVAHRPAYLAYAARRGSCRDTVQPGARSLCILPGLLRRGRRLRAKLGSGWGLADPHPLARHGGDGADVREVVGVGGRSDVRTAAAGRPRAGPDPWHGSRPGLARP